MTGARIPRVVVCGAVDDGKSTLIGRLLVDTGTAPLDEIAGITAADGTVDFARLTDGLVAEREQGITIDVAYRYLRLPDGSRVLLADSPGHEQYTRNMAVAAASADVAVIVVDLVTGVRDQTIRHATVSYLMGVRSFIVALNKIDALSPGERSAAVASARSEILGRVTHLTEEPVPAGTDGDEAHVTFVPISALRGENVLTATAGDSAHDGTSLAPSEAPSLVDALIHGVSSAAARELSGPARLPVQVVLKSQATRSYAGLLATGVMTVGDPVAVWPSGTRTRITSITVAGRPADSAFAGDSVAVELADEVDVSRGDVISVSEADTAPPAGSRAHLADLVWISDQPLDNNASYLLRCGPASVATHVPVVRYRYDLSTGSHARTTSVEKNDVARVEVTSNQPLLLTPYADSRDMGGFILCDRATGQTVAAGMTVEPLTRESDVTKHDFEVTRESREALFGLRAGVLWLTGLSGSGKSTIADALEAQLVGLGIHAYVLDGDSVRQTLSEDLGFSPEDRAENIRRVARVAQMFMDAGVVAIVSLVSPFSADRAAARELFADDDFVEVFVDTPLEVCEQRDSKGLYARARAADASQMTGIGQQYEAPVSPEFHLDGLASVEKNTQLLREWVLARRITRP